jgi:hypothetical protein
MSGIGQRGAASVSYIGDAPGSSNSTFSLSTPAGWTMVWWSLAVLFILVMFLML